MKRIWKYNIPYVKDKQTIRGRFCKFLGVGIQGDTPVMWALVGDEAIERDVTVYTIWTGQHIPSEITGNVEYVGTYQILVERTAFVGHVFVAD
jgi:hypothetical protein